MRNTIGFGVALGLWIAASSCSSDDDDTGATAGQSGAGTMAGTAGKPSSAGQPGTAGSGGSKPGGSAGTSGGSAKGGSAGRGGGSHGGQASGGTPSGGAAGADEAGTGGEAGSVPSSAWVNVTGNLANMASECGNLTLLSATPDTGVVIAGVALHGLFASDDGGAHWEPLGTGAGSAEITNRPASIVYDPDHPGTFWESGIYNGGGVYRTTDAGRTFTQLGTISHNDLVSIDFTDPDRKTLLVGGHEQKQTLYLSRDGGGSFDPIGQNLPGDSHFSSAPLVLDDKTFLLGACGYGDGTCGVYRSDDGGDSWTRVSDIPVAARPLWESGGAIDWSVIYNGGLARGNADGTSFSKVADNLTTAYPVELPDGRILTIRGDHVVASADHGSTWEPVGETLPFTAAGVVYSVQRKTLFVWQWDCGSQVLPNAIASAGFDYEQP